MTSSLHHRYAESQGHEDPDNPPPLVLRVDRLSDHSIDEIARFLTDHIDVRCNLDGVKTHLGARPIAVEFDSNTCITERTFWLLEIESAGGSPARALRYIDAVIDHASGELPFCTNLEVLGQHSIYAYLDLYLGRSLIQFPDDSRPLLSVLRAFTRYLKASDIDHEVAHHAYVGNVLRFLKLKSTEEFIELLLYYLETQFSDAVMSFDTLSGDGVLKNAVDHAIARRTGWSLRSHVLALCAHVYGNNHELTEDVISYCRMRADVGDEHGLIDFAKALSYTRQMQDIQWAHYPRKIRTGFHEHDGKHWKRVDENLWNHA